VILGVAGAKSNGQRLMSKRAVKLCVRRIELLCASTAARAFGLASAVTSRISPVLTSFAPVVTPFVTALASILAAFHSSCLSVCI
jgi:hypothetical protein